MHVEEAQGEGALSVCLAAAPSQLFRPALDRQNKNVKNPVTSLKSNKTAKTTSFICFYCQYVRIGTNRSAGSFILHLFQFRNKHTSLLDDQPPETGTNFIHEESIIGSKAYRSIQCKWNVCLCVNVLSLWILVQQFSLFSQILDLYPVSRIVHGSIAKASDSIWPQCDLCRNTVEKMLHQVPWWFYPQDLKLSCHLQGQLHRVLYNNWTGCD